MRRNTEYIAPGLRSAMDHEFKITLHIEWVVDASQVPTSVPQKSPGHIPDQGASDEVEGTEEVGIVVDSVAGHLISEMFPGAEEIS
jgi:hypothetical protein